MGYIMRCDVCGEGFETDNPDNNSLLLFQGQNLVGKIIVCNSCLKKKVNLFFHIPSNENEKKDKNENEVNEK